VVQYYLAEIHRNLCELYICLHI